MGWADQYITRLLAGETVQFRPRGNSMRGRVESGELCTVEPVAKQVIHAGDVVLCKVKGNQYLHLVKAVRRHEGDKPSYQIGNVSGHVNGWTTTIYGKLVKVET